MYFVRYSELLAAFGTTRSQNATAVSSSHTLTETMLVVSLAIVGLVRSFHFLYRYNYYAVQCSRIRHSSDKIRNIFLIGKVFVLFSAFFMPEGSDLFSLLRKTSGLLCYQCGILEVVDLHRATHIGQGVGSGCAGFFAPFAEYFVDGRNILLPFETTGANGF